MLISSTKNRKIYERDCSIRERLAKAKEDAKHTVTTVEKSKGKEQRKRDGLTALLPSSQRSIGWWGRRKMGDINNAKKAVE